MFLVHHGGRVDMIINFSTVVKISVGELFLLPDFEIFIEKGVEVKFVR